MVHDAKKAVGMILWNGREGREGGEEGGRREGKREGGGRGREGREGGRDRNYRLDYWRSLVNYNNLGSMLATAASNGPRLNPVHPPKQHKNPGKSET